MRFTGVVKTIDKLGRLVIPKELRENLELGENDGVEFFVDGQLIILRKQAVVCTFCNGHKNLIEFKNKKICGECLASIKRR